MGKGRVGVSAISELVVVETIGVGGCLIGVGIVAVAVALMEQGVIGLRPVSLGGRDDDRGEQEEGYDG